MTIASFPAIPVYLLFGEPVKKALTAGSPVKE